MGVVYIYIYVAVNKYATPAMMTIIWLVVGEIDGKFLSVVKLIKAPVSRWMQAASKWKCISEAYAQQWTFEDWYDDESLFLSQNLINIALYRRKLFEGK